MVKITQDFPFFEYACEEELSSEEKALVKAVFGVLTASGDLASVCRKYGIDQKKMQSFAASVDVLNIGKPVSSKVRSEMVSGLSEILPVPNAKAVSLAVVDALHGYSVIQPLLNDENVEEITFNGDDPVFIYHREKGVCKTNLSFSKEELNAFLAQLSIQSDEGVVETRLADGSRASILTPPIVANYSVTVRKFRAHPLSIMDLIENNTVTLELAAFLWTAVDGLMVTPFNFLIVGSTSAGKTSLLNACSAFIPPSERIVVIEDVPEINLSSKQNSVQATATPAFDMQALLKSSLRLRPDRIIVGDIRGREAETMFTAMNTGHRGVMGTLHANNAADAMTRLQNEPMNVPRGLLPLCDLIIVQQRFNDRKKGIIRRVVQVAEVSKIEEEIIAMNDLFLYDPISDSIERTRFQSLAVEKLSKAMNVSINEVKASIDQRVEILKELQKEGVQQSSDVNAFMLKYYEHYYRGS
ncbi:MAG: ATPase, T2SS/T4P/T4SS family [Candidatus Norongarragalinales archaeon]